MRHLKKVVSAMLNPLGLELVRRKPAPELEGMEDLSGREKSILSTVMPYTMAGPLRVAALLHSVRYLVSSGVPGDIVECGVWRGGGMMAAALSLLALGDTSRNLYLYDTFEGLPPPTEADVGYDGTPAREQFDRIMQKEGAAWCYSGIDEVRNNMAATGYPMGKVIFVKGKVEVTIPQTLPGQIGLLRLDTDWYESTRHELIHMLPLLVRHGILIIDDYGHWQGAKKAVDEYFAALGWVPYLHRIDYAGRIFVLGQA